MAKRIKRSAPPTSSKKTKTNQRTAKKTAKKPVKKKSTKNKKVQPVKKVGLISTLFKWGFVLSIWGVIFLTLILGWYGAELPKLTQNADFVRKSTITIKASDGSIITRYGNIKGNAISLHDLPPHLPQAVIAIEDRRFYTHFGIDPIGLSRALVTNIIGGGVRQGGSTITQQLAKNLFLSHERTLKRKIQEAMLAIWLEHELSKDDILSAYLNRVYLGSGAYGMDAAAQRFFNKSASHVTLKEAAILAGLLKAPSHYSPLHAPAAAEKRSQIVLKSMVRAGFITQEQAQNAKKIAVTDAAPRQLLQNRARYFTDWVITALDDLIGDTNEDLIIETTLSPRLQTITEDELAATINSIADKRNAQQAAMVIMDPQGAILAMVGGKNYGSSQFNRAAQSRRQPGSAFKPIVFATALEKGWDIDDKILDAPFEEKDKYRPNNFNDKYYGEISLQRALEKSANTASVRLMKASGGPRATIKTARKLGISSKLSSDLSLALGSSGVSLTELTGAYASIANGGYGVKPFAITRITSADDILYFNRNGSPKGKRVLSRSAAKGLKQALRQVVSQGTGKKAAISSVEISGKTGTSQDNRDAWFMGYTDEFVAGVWVGNDDNSPMDGVTGGSVPAIIWRHVIARSLDENISFSEGWQPFGGSFKKLLNKILPDAPEIKRPDYNLNE